MSAVSSDATSLLIATDGDFDAQLCSRVTGSLPAALAPALPGGVVSAVTLALLTGTRSQCSRRSPESNELTPTLAA
jgi:hypothetical protein